MDLSAVIFAALAVAWAVYLVPKALHHHEDTARTRSLEEYSETMRVLASREPVDHRSARLVVTGARPGGPLPETPADPASPSHAELTPAQQRARRVVIQRATRRRRNVLGMLLVALVTVAVLAALGVLTWLALSIPAALLVTWLVACRVMVRGERAAFVPASEPVAEAAARWADDDTASDLPVIPATSTAIDPRLWDPLPVTLPTYVTKPVAATRTVRTIDLDDSGVWTSGRSEIDSRIARDADEAERVARAAQRAGEGQQAIGS